MALTPHQLRDLIDSDPVAKSFADAGDDVSCATRCSLIAQAVPVPTLRAYTGLSSAEIGVGVAATRRLIVSVRAAAAADPLIDELQAKLRGDTGLDVADAGVQSSLDQLAALAVPSGLTTDDAAAIKALCLQHPDIGHEQISKAWAPHRAIFRREVRDPQGGITVVDTMGSL